MAARRITVTVITTMPRSETAALLRLQSWLSPAFPIGAFSYSHGLEWAVEEGRVRDRATLIDWLSGDIAHGSLFADAAFFARAWDAAGDADDIVEIADLAAAMRGSAELALEAETQGRAFLSTLRAAWPDLGLDRLAAVLEAAGIAPTPAAVAGVAARLAGAPRSAATALYLQSTVANLINAAVRLVPLGQTDGQRAAAALEPVVLAAAETAVACPLDDIGSSAVMVDIATMRHETQYTRLFRS